MLKDIFILSGVGVGGGSLVYANTLLVPKESIWEDPLWADLYPWKQVMPAHYQTAQRMLGATENPRLFESDNLLKKYSQTLGRDHTFQKTQVGVYFGPHGTQNEEGQTFPDPFFQGKGPERRACIHCGGCMVGCRHHAKNTLDKNYLYLAEKQGATILPETKATLIEPLKDHGYKVHLRTSTGIFKNPIPFLTAKKVIVSAGVLGTVPLLLHCKDKGALPHLSNQLGNFVRSNSEAILGATQYRKTIDFSSGIAIGSGFYPDENTHIEVCRYPKGSDALGLLGAVLTDGGPGRKRPFRWFLNCLKNPRAALRSLWPFGWAQRTLILLVMQTLKNHMRMTLHRPLYWPFSKKITTQNSNQTPTYIPAGNQAARVLSGMIGGTPQSSIHEVLFDTPTTAHILGGCPMGKTPEDGVIDQAGQVFGYPGLYVIDGSMIGANLGVNPSLTITALAEHAMSQVPIHSS